MIDKLKTLEEHNIDSLDAFKKGVEDRLNGIECPSCGNELYDKQGIILPTYPAQYPIFCKKCEYKGTRF